MICRCSLVDREISLLPPEGVSDANDFQQGGRLYLRVEYLKQKVLDMQLEKLPFYRRTTPAMDERLVERGRGGKEVGGRVSGELGGTASRQTFTFHLVQQPDE